MMSLGSTVEDTGLDLMRGNNESSDEENRRLRKLNQEGLTTFKNFRSIEMNFFLNFEIFYGILLLIDFDFFDFKEGCGHW